MLNKIKVLSLLFGCIFSNVTQSKITATQMGMLDFKISQNLTASDMDGTNDVTDKLQAAVNAASATFQTLFIPSGTYKVSNTIDCVLDYGKSPYTVVNMVGSTVNRPTIVLADGATGFDGSIPKCVIKYRSTVHTTPDWIMEGGIRSINFDLGTGNPMAVAVNWGCAQYCFIEDISIEANSSFAGFLAIGGANQLLANVSVNGGQYGIYLPNHNEAIDWGLSGEIAQSTITGCTFTNQTVNALHLWGYGGITMSGITISQASGTAIYMKGDSYAPVICFPFSFIDSKIIFTSSNSSNTAISNLSRCNVALNGIYVTGAGTIVNNDGDENLTVRTPVDYWTHIARFNYVDKAARHDGQGVNYQGTHFNALGGVYSTAAIIQIDSLTPPTDLTSKHIWESTPSFEDADAFLVPLGSSAATIQDAINAHQKVFLPKGTYSLSTPITLKANSIFCGCPGIGRCGTILSNGFTPLAATWLITTESIAAATTYMMDITTNTTGIDFMGSLNWKAGSNSIIRTIHLDAAYQTNEPNMIRLYFSGNGGGRVFNYQDEKATSGIYNPGYRKVKISGTNQPLTFYGLNLERGGAKYPVSSWPMCEIVNASKVMIFGAKTEAFQPYATINGCRDIFITNVIDYSANGYGATGANQIEISGTNDQIELSNLIWLGPPTQSWKLVLDPWNQNGPPRTMFLGLYHRNFTTFFSTDSVPPPVIIDPSKLNKLSIYPNPTNSDCNIHYTSNQILTMRGSIYNMSGSIVSAFLVNSNETKKLELSNISSGVYFVVIQAPKGQKDCLKVIKY